MAIVEQMSVSALRRLLPEGAEFTAEHLVTTVICGNSGTTVCPPKPPNKRRVIKQTTHQMVSEIIEGDRCGAKVYCTWRGVVVRKHESGVELVLPGDEHPFVRLTNITH